MTTTPKNARAMRHFSLAASGAVLAASAWAAGAAPEGLGLDARMWQGEIAASEAEDADDGWYAMAVSDTLVDVREVPRPSGPARVTPDLLYLHLPGTPLSAGLRINHGFSARQLRPVPGLEYRRSLGRTDYSFRVWSNEVGTAYVVRYDGIDHEYLLGRPGAATRVHAIADLDGDRRPDFVVEVGGAFYLLLSSQARAGVNLPSAQVWAGARTLT